MPSTGQYTPGYSGKAAALMARRTASVIGEYLAQRLDAAGHTAGALGPRTWMVEPGAVFAQAWFEAVGTKSGDNVSPKEAPGASRHEMRG